MLENSEDNLHDKFIRFFICFYVMICSFFQSSNSIAYVGDAQNIDSSGIAFDHIEILKWAKQNEKAISLLNDFLEQEDIKKNKIIHVYNELADNNRWLGNYQQALNILQKVHHEYQIDSSFEEIEFVRSNFYKGKVFRSQGMLDSAEMYHHKALFLADTFGIINSSIVGEIWMDLAFAQTNRTVDRQKALDYNIYAQNNYFITLDIWNIKFAQVFYELASNYRTLGDFERAINYARMAEIIYTYHGDLFSNLIMYSKVIQGNCYFDNKNYEKADNIFNDIIKDYPESAKRQGDSFSRILISNGATLLQLGQYVESRKLFEKSIIFNPLEDIEDSLSLVYSLRYLAQNLEKLERFKLAKEKLDIAVFISLELFGHKHFEVYDSYRHSGKYYEELNQFENALDFYQKALLSGFSDFNDKNIYSNPNSFDSIPKEAAFSILFDKARTFKKKYTRGQKIKDLLAAIDLYKIAYGLIRESANSDFMEESLLNIPENFHEDLNYGVECAMTLFENTNNHEYLNQLLQFVETNKYFLLQNSIAKSRNRTTLGIPDSAYQKERDLLQKINSLKQEINNTTFNNDHEEYEKRLALLHTTIEWEEVRKLWSTSDESAFSMADLSNTISIDSLRKQLIGENDMLLEYFQTSDTLYTLALSKDDAEIFRIPKSQELDDTIEDYLNHIFYYENSETIDDFREYVNVSYYLFERLVQPTLATFSSQGNTRRLIIIPDGQLSLLPFESLIQELPDTTYQNYFGLNYLCRDYVINYGYSINILKNNQFTTSNIKNARILALSYSSSNQQSDSVSRDDEFGELPYSAVELRSIRKQVRNGTFLDGDNATEYNFKSNLKDYSIIHLALHGVGDTSDMLNSRIIFKGPGNPTQDGFLYAHELYGIDLSRKQLAVLSACETGIGKRMQGEGIYSLARGFVYAGCPSVIMSLWKVNDQTTAEIMDYFYQYIVAGLPKDKALQQAKLSYLQNSDDLGAHPANWAAFIALGNNEPIELPDTTSKWYYWIVLLVIIGASLMLYRNMRSGKNDVV